MGKLSSPDEASEALHVCTMAMEVVVVLFNHQICLNPLAPRELQQLEDMPPVAEVGKQASVRIRQGGALGFVGACGMLLQRPILLLFGCCGLTD